MKLAVEVCLPRDAATLTLVRRVVAGALESFGVTRTCLDDIRVAVNEACANVVEHAATDDEYEVRLEVDAERCAITVRNVGNGFDAGDLDGVMPGPRSPRGRGVAMMRALMDRVQFTSEPETGTIVRLVKGLEVEPGGPLDALHRRDGAAT